MVTLDGSKSSHRFEATGSSCNLGHFVPELHVMPNWQLKCQQGKKDLNSWRFN